jgi:hypothetical protein
MLEKIELKKKSESASINPDKDFLKVLALRKTNQALCDKFKGSGGDKRFALDSEKDKGTCLS